MSTRLEVAQSMWTCCMCDSGVSVCRPEALQEAEELSEVTVGRWQQSFMKPVSLSADPERRHGTPLPEKLGRTEHKLNSCGTE